MPYQIYPVIAIIVLIILLIPFTIQIFLVLPDQEAQKATTEIRVQFLNRLLKENQLSRLPNLQTLIDSIPGLKQINLAKIAFKDQFVSRSSELPKDQLKMLRMILGSILVKRLEWKSIIGFDDAMYTAIGAGSLWALKGLLLSFLSSITHLEKCIIQVQPDFSDKKLKSQVYCILKIRIVHIILIVIYVFGLNVRGYWHGITRKAKPSN